MSDFSLTTLFVVPTTQTALASTGSTNNLLPGQLGVFTDAYVSVPGGSTIASPYFYIAQGRQDNYMQGSKRSDKIGTKLNNVIEWYKVTGSNVALNQITEISDFKAKCGEDLTITLRGFSYYLDTLYFNGITQSVIVKTPCCDCAGTNPCDIVDTIALVDIIIAKLNETRMFNSRNSITLSTLYSFTKVLTPAVAAIPASGGNPPVAAVLAGAKLVITGKPLTKYGNACDITAFPYEYDRLRFDVFAYAGPDTSADFIVSDACEKLAIITKIQDATYPKGTAEEIKLLETRYHSYQTSILKTLFKLSAYNQTYETYATSGIVYDTYYIKYNEFEKGTGNWSDNVSFDATTIISIPQGNPINTALQTMLIARLGSL